MSVELKQFEKVLSFHLITFMSSGFQCPSVYRQTRYTAKLPSTDCTESGALTREHSSLIFVPHATDFHCLSPNILNSMLIGQMLTII
jgi:hypothetical protein